MGLVEKILKAYKAKDQDVQKEDTQVEQEELSCMENLDEATY